jgi:hypothetical protein
MRFTKFLTLALATGAFATTGATADPGHGAKPDKPAKACHGKAKVMVVLKGTLANDPAAGDTSFQLMVKHGNSRGRLYAKAANPVSVGVDANTRIRKDGQSSTLDALAQNDRAVVLAKVCRSDLKQARESGAALPALTARLVLARSPESPSGDGASS